MAKTKQRYISTTFWDDAWIQECDPSEKLLYLYLMTNPLTNIAGVYKITMRRIVFDTGFNEEMVKQIMQRFREAGKAYLEGEYIVIPAWPSHQRHEENKNIRKGIESILENLPETMIQFLQSVQYRYNLKGLTRPYTPLHALEGGSTGLNYLNPNININTNPNTNEKLSTTVDNSEPDIFPPARDEKIEPTSCDACGESKMLRQSTISKHVDYVQCSTCRRTWELKKKLWIMTDEGKK